MQDQELKVKKSNVLKAFKDASPKSKKLLTDLFGEDAVSQKITDRVKTYEDACDIEGIKPLTLADFKFLPAKDQVAMFSIHRLTVITRVLNEGWEPNWDDSNEYKRYPWFYMQSDTAGGPGFSFYDSGHAYSASDVGSRLVFKSGQLAEYAAKQFLAEYQEWFVINK